MLTLLIQIFKPDIVHLKDDQDVTPVFLAAQQGMMIWLYRSVKLYFLRLLSSHVYT